MPRVAAGARHVEPSALHGIVGTRGAGRSAATTRRALLPRLLPRCASSTAPSEQIDMFLYHGVSVVFIARKLGVAQPTARTHLQTLARAGLVTFGRVGQWTFYKREIRVEL